MIDSIVIQVKNVFNLFAVYYYEIWYYLNSPPSASVQYYFRYRIRKNEGYGLDHKIKKAPESTRWETKRHVEQMFWDVLNVLINVLQKNRINKNICCVYILYIICYMKYIHNDIYYKELAHVILEAETPCDLLSAGWRPKKSYGLKSNLNLKV